MHGTGSGIDVVFGWGASRTGNTQLSRGARRNSRLLNASHNKRRRRTNPRVTKCHYNRRSIARRIRANDGEDLWRGFNRTGCSFPLSRPCRGQSTSVPVLTHYILSVDFRFAMQGPTSCKVSAWERANMTKHSRLGPRFLSINISAPELNFELRGYRNNDCIGIIERMGVPIT